MQKRKPTQLGFCQVLKMLWLSQLRGRAGRDGDRHQKRQAQTSDTHPGYLGTYIEGRRSPTEPHIPLHVVLSTFVRLNFWNTMQTDLHRLCLRRLCRALHSTSLNVFFPHCVVCGLGPFSQPHSLLCSVLSGRLDWLMWKVCAEHTTSAFGSGILIHTRNTRLPQSLTPNPATHCFLIPFLSFSSFTHSEHQVVRMEGS